MLRDNGDGGVCKSSGEATANVPSRRRSVPKFSLWEGMFVHMYGFSFLARAQIRFWSGLPGPLHNDDGDNEGGGDYDDDWRW